MASGNVDVIARVQSLVSIDAIADDPVLSRFFSSGQVVKVAAGNYVFQKNDLCENYLIVLDGVVRVQLSTDAGREATLYRVQSGGSCSLTTSCLIGGERYPAEAITESDVVAIAISNSEFQIALERSERFRHFVFDGFATRLTAVIGLLNRMAFVSIDKSLASILLDHNDGGVSVVTHQYLATELGTAREVISRKLKQFESQGLVQLGRGRINIIALKKLQALVTP